MGLRAINAVSEANTVRHDLESYFSVNLHLLTTSAMRHLAGGPAVLGSSGNTSAIAKCVDMGQVKIQSENSWSLGDGGLGIFFFRSWSMD